MTPPPPWIEYRREDGAHVLHLSNAWRLAHVRDIAGSLQALPLGRGCAFMLDGSRLEAIDTSAAFMLFRHLAELGCGEAEVGTRGFDPHHERLLRLVHERMKTPSAPPRGMALGVVQRFGSAALAVWELLKSQTAFFGTVVLQAAGLLRRPGLFRPKEAVTQLDAVGLNAIPIVALVNFLIGVVFTYLLGIQALRYGANIFVVDGVGMALCRELAPLLTSIIVAGRSGAAFTAQIGSMKVQEELDAITMLGLSPIQVLVIPRIVAIMLALPLLVFVGDVAGLAGSMLVANLQLDITPDTFIERLQRVLPPRHFIIGLAKVPVFGAVIALTACRMGMSVARDTRSVGINTTSTVVQSIVWVIVLDAVFAVVLQHLGI